MIKELDELYKRFTKPNQVSVSIVEIDTVTGDLKKESSKFIQDVATVMQRKKHNQTIYVALTY